MSRHFLYSTLTADQLYTTWRPAGEGGSHHTVERQILVRGGSNVPNKNLITTRGTVTEISEDDYALLMGSIDNTEHPDYMKTGNHVFKTHMKNGFLVHRMEKADPGEVAAAELEARDESAPVTPNDPRLQNEGGVHEKTEKPTVVERLKGMVGL